MPPNALSASLAALGRPRKLLADGIVLLPLVQLAIALIFSRVVEPNERVFFPDDMSIRYPYAVEETVSSGWLMAISTIFPCLLLVALSVYKRFGVREVVYALNAMLVAITFAMMLTDTTKSIVGKLRPDFLDRCKPVLNPLAQGRNKWVCTGDEALVRGGRVSFPSGHTSLTFAGGSFLALFFRGTLTPRYRASPWSKLLYALIVSPATWTAITRYNDNRHHPIDIFCGFLVGIFSSIVWYRAYFVAPTPQHGSGIGGVSGRPFLAAPMLVPTPYALLPRADPSSLSVADKLDATSRAGARGAPYLALVSERDLDALSDHPDAEGEELRGVSIGAAAGSRMGSSLAPLNAPGSSSRRPSERADMAMVEQPDVAQPAALRAGVARQESDVPAH